MTNILRRKEGDADGGKGHVTMEVEIETCSLKPWSPWSCQKPGEARQVHSDFGGIMALPTLEFILLASRTVREQIYVVLNLW